MSHEKFISVKEMMDYMRSGSPFYITYVTYDKRKGTGGGVKNIDRAILLAKDKTEAENKTAQQNKTTLVFNIKKPNHFANSTLNIRVMAAGNADIRKVHVQLIRKFNGATVK